MTGEDNVRVMALRELFAKGKPEQVLKVVMTALAVEQWHLDWSELRRGLERLESHEVDITVDAKGTGVFIHRRQAVCKECGQVKP